MQVELTAAMETCSKNWKKSLSCVACLGVKCGEPAKQAILQDAPKV